MKRFKLLIPLLCLSCTTLAQVSTENYIRTRTMLKDDGSSHVDNIAYFDGLGRPFQTVEKVVKDNIQTGNILVTLKEYDAVSRNTYTWIPIKTASDYISPDNFKSMALSSYDGDARPYNHFIYDASPLNRITGQYGPGASWEGHPVLTGYSVNSVTAPLSCINYTVAAGNTLYANGNYTAGQLSVVRTTDEDGNTSYTFTDKQGHTVLIRQMNGDDPCDTYYVYDDFGNLCFVLQPMYQMNADLDLYAFQYRYDQRNRCIWKKLPGTAPTEYIYGDLDSPTFSQDGNQRTNGKWTYYLYDNLGRLTEQGECTNQSVTSNAVVQIQNYYDDYSFVGSTGFPVSQFTNDISGYGKGALTGQKVIGFNICSPVWKAFYYDIRGREVKRVESNAMGGYDVTATVYSFTDKPLILTHTHTSSKKNLVEVYTYSYDYADRLLKVQHKLDDLGTVTLAEYGYDNLGRLNSKKLGGTAHSSAYSYNIRSWLTGITGGKFTQTLTYNNGSTGYNGNITTMNWTANGSSHSYSFSYDGLNRLLNATHGAGRFTEKVTSYDKNGNIKSLQRYGQISVSAYGLIDNLTYTLDGNRLNRVDDAATASAHNGGFEFKDGVKQADEYAYDANGNLTKDLNKGISNIQYNCLNLPTSVGYSSGGFSQFGYTADGVKRREILHTVSGAGDIPSYIVYCGNVIYEDNVAKFLLTEEGYVTLADNTYHYYVKDHQGNNRLVVNSSGTVEEVNHYYPFGGLFASSSPSVQPYKYNGKELNTKKGVNWYDYGARQYDAALGQFTTVDPLAEKYSSTNPFAYCLNNPIKYIDPTGCDTVPANEVWDYNLVNYRSNGIGLLDEKFIPVTVNGKDKYHLHKITTGENEGNYMAIEQLGVDEESGTRMYEYKYVVGRDKFNDFKSGNTQAHGMQYNWVKYANDNGVDGTKGIWENMSKGYWNIMTDPLTWLPNPLDATNLIPKSYYQIKPWNRFLMQTRGQYTIKKYGTYQNALKSRSIDYQKWKQNHY